MLSALIRCRRCQKYIIGRVASFGVKCCGRGDDLWRAAPGQTLICRPNKKEAQHRQLPLTIIDFRLTGVIDCRFLLMFFPNGLVPSWPNQPAVEGPEFTNARHAASCGLLLWSSASPRPARLQWLPQAVCLNQHIFWISKLLLPRSRPKQVQSLCSRSTSRSTNSKLTSPRFSSTMLTAGVIAADRALRSRNLC
jgi:hypothetical protein